MQNKNILLSRITMLYFLLILIIPNLPVPLKPFKSTPNNINRDCNAGKNREGASRYHILLCGYSLQTSTLNKTDLRTIREASSAFFLDPSWWDTLYFRIFTVCVLLLIGYFIYRRQQTMQQQNRFTRQLLDSMEVERKRIATELHDSIGQELLIIKNRALLALGNLKDKKNVRQQLDEISDTASRAIQETREITYNLRPYQIDRLGLKKALESIITRAAETTTIAFSTDIDPIDNLIPKEMEIHVYRIIQECVNNIIKHANATAGKVAIKRWYNRLNIDVEDNGTGFDVSLNKSRNTGGIGLHGLMERTRLIGGTTRVESNPGKGTRILVTIKTYERIDAAS